MRHDGAKLRAEIKRLRDGYLLDENGNEYVQVCILKDKIKELAVLLAPLTRWLALITEILLRVR